MEDFTLEIDRLLRKKLSLYQELNLVFNREKEYITKIDIDSLWKSSEEKKLIAKDIEQVRVDILKILETDLGLTQMDIHTFSLAHMIRILPVKSDKKTGLRVIKLAIDNEKNRLTQTAKDNKKFVTEYLSVIDEIMGTVVDQSKLARYNQAGTVPKAHASKCLIHAEA